MPAKVQNDRLIYRNEPFSIHHLIDNCPPHTVIRELIKNSEENAALLQPAGTIQWFSEKVDGVRKLGLYNEGPGMSDRALSELMDLASTGKKLGTDANYGQGAKVSGLRASPFGLIYRSCTKGKVHQIHLAVEHQPGFDFPVCVKKRFQTEEGDWQTVLDVTDLTHRSTHQDWTEVILLGTRANHDTVEELLPETKSKNWLMRLINQRFYRFPKGIEVRNANLSTGQPSRRHAIGLEGHVMDHTERHEDVSAEHLKYGPVVIRFIKLKGSWSKDDKQGPAYNRGHTLEAYGIGTRGDHVCLVWKDECYDLRTGWSQISGAFGMTFGVANLAVQILLPDSAPVKNNTYRNAINEKANEHRQVYVEGFAELVRVSRPQWLIEYLEAEARKNTDNSGVMERLQSFLDQLKAQAASRPVVEGEGEEEGSASPERKGTGGQGGNEGNDGEPIAAEPKKKPTAGKRSAAATLGIPRVDFTNDPAILDEIGGKAAVYKGDENMVLLNSGYHKYVKDLDVAYQTAGADAGRRSLAKHIYDEEYCVNAGKFVIQAWLNRGRPEFTDEDFEQAISMGSLSTSLNSPATIHQALKRLRQRLNSTKMEAIEEE